MYKICRHVFNTDVPNINIVFFSRLNRLEKYRISNKNRSLKRKKVV